jgi:hypothetical protein
LKRFHLQQILNLVCEAGQSRKKVRRRKTLQHQFFKLLIFIIMKNLTVVLNIVGMSAPELISLARFYVQRITDNASNFPSCAATAAKVAAAASELEIADEAAIDGGKTKTRLKADKDRELRAQLVILSHRVQEDAAGDETLVHLAGMEVKRTGTRTVAEFKAEAGAHPGDVKLTVKSRANTMYKWQYATDPSLASWIDAGFSRSCKKAIGHLSSGVYWFRVIFIDDEGEHNGEALKFAVT